MKNIDAVMRFWRVYFNRYEHKLDRRVGVLPFGNGVQLDLWFFRMFVYKLLPGWRGEPRRERART